MEKLEHVNKIIIHHTDRQYDHPFLIKIRHKLLRWWEDIWYHFIIGNWYLWTIDGKIYEWRSELYQWAHAFWYNKDSIWISLIGDFDKYNPTDLQLNSLYKLLSSKIEQYSVNISNILWHNELVMKNIKTCPGKNLYMDDIRTTLNSNWL